MEKNKQLTIWVLIDIALLVGAIFVSAYWFNIASDLKDPCYNCGKERPEIKPCLEKPVYVNPYLDIDLNFSYKEILEKEK